MLYHYVKNIDSHRRYILFLIEHTARTICSFMNKTQNLPFKELLNLSL